jgi:hypothetical protein
VTVTAPPSPATPPAQPVTAGAIVAVAGRIFLRMARAGGYYGECDSGSDFAQCPVTVRLLVRLKQNPTGGPGGGSVPFCRCQNFWPNQTVTATVTPNGGVAHVTIFGNVVIDLIMTEVDGVLLVDDTQCDGRGASTSIYATPVVPCSP